MKKKKKTTRVYFKPVPFIIHISCNRHSIKLYFCLNTLKQKRCKTCMKLVLNYYFCKVKFQVTFQVDKCFLVQRASRFYYIRELSCSKILL